MEIGLVDTTVKYEYKIANSETDLNRYGKDGFRLVPGAVLLGAGNISQYIMERIV